MSAYVDKVFLCIHDLKRKNSSIKYEYLLLKTELETHTIVSHALNWTDAD